MGDRSRWSLVMAFSAVVAATQMLWVTFTPITTDSAHILHVSEGSVGWLSEVFPLLYVPLSIPFGIWIDRWFRGSLALGALLTVVGASLRAIVPNFGGILVAQMIISLGQPLVVNAINKVAVAYVAERRRPTAIAIGSSSLFFGILLSMLSAPLLTGTHDFGILLWLQAAFTVVSVLCLLVSLRHKPEYIQPSQAHAPLRHVWKDPLNRLLSFLLFIGFGLFIAITTWLQALLAGKSVSDLSVGIALACMTGAGIIGAGVLPDWAIRTGRSRTVLFASMLSTALTLIVILFGHPFWLLTGMLALTGFLVLADLPIVLSVTELHVPPAEVGTATGLLLLFGNTGGIVLALLVQGFITSPVVAVAILFLAAIVALPMVARFPVNISPSGRPDLHEGSNSLYR